MAVDGTDPESHRNVPVSFGFSKRKEPTIQLSKERKSEEEELDYVTSLEDNTLHSVKPKEAKKALVIPLIKSNQWRTVPTDSVPAGTGDDLQQAAVNELLEDARKYNDTERASSDAALSMVIPLLMQNKVPEGFETDDKLDVSLRPEAPSDADYEQIPIEEYGVALLRGMGWKEGEGIGKNKQLTKAVDAVVRPKGMGLGADRSALLQKQPDKRGGHSSVSQGRKPGDKRHGNDDEPPLEFKKGVHCVVERGPHRDLYGTIEGVDEDNCRCMVKLTVGGQSVSLSQYSVKLVQKSEFEKNSRYLNSSKYEQHKQAEAAEHAESRNLSGRSNGGSSNSAASSGSNSANLKRKHEDKHRSATVSTSTNSRDPSDTRRSVSSNLWLQQLLRVRIVDKRYKGGAYYNTKVTVEDVLGVDRVVCRTDDGSVLDGLQQSMLETVVPRDESSLVMVVSGQFKGQLAEIMKRDKSKCTATLQLIADRDRLVQVSYDDICEWTGDAGNLLDY